jgi:hypothetical protein
MFSQRKYISRHQIACFKATQRLHPHLQRGSKALFTRNYSKETERLRESQNSSLGDSAYVIQWRFSDGATGGDGSPPVAPFEKRH